MKKGIITIIASLFAIISLFVPVYAQEDSVFEVGEVQSEDQPLMNVDENGNVTPVDTEALEQELSQTPMIMSDDMSRNVSVGVVNFRTKPSAAYNTLYTEDGTNKQGYLNGYSASDGAFLGYNSDYSKVKFKMAGVTGWVSASEVQVIDYNSVASVSYYSVSSGYIYHTITNNVYSSNYASKILIGYNPGYLQEGVPYYSYDGHYFYTSYASMLSDYKQGVYTNSVNNNSPYYNYYQYLPHRSKTTFTAKELDNLTASKANGKLNGLGSYFIQYQNTYGTNAALVYSVAVLESGWGTSSIAQNKNNLFGHGAVDSNPYYGANGYSKPSDSILYHSKVFISEGYCDPLDYSGRYFGSHLGDKGSGINVKYASDPYWGEKAASICWQLALYTNKNDYDTYALGIKTKNVNLNVRKEANSSSTNLYQTGNADNYPFIILDEVQGSNVSGNNVWYKIQSDPTLDSTRSKIVQDKGDYNFNNFYGYVSSVYVTKVKQGNNQTSQDLLLGDVNLDGSITPSDYVKVKNYIMKKTTLEGNALKAADMNQDGSITPADYVKIKNTIMGK